MPRRKILSSTLPEGLIIDVLLRLPVKKIIHCKSVCKTWHGIISDPYFIKLHMSTSPESLLYHHNESDTVTWVEMEHETDFHVTPVKTLDLKRYSSAPDPVMLILIGSVNGLVCHWEVDNCLTYIMNPVLNEYIALPRARADWKGYDCHYGHSYGFGVSSAGEYKVVQITYRKDVKKEFIGLNPSEIHVYTLGTGKWRSLGPTSFSLNLRRRTTTPVVYLKNHLYWQFGDYDERMYDFDLNRETFELFPSPPVRSKVFGVIKGWISCIGWSSLGMEFWVMKEKSWYKEITIKKNMNPLFFNSNPWRPECYIDGTSIMLVCDYGTDQLVAYCLDTNKVVPLNWGVNTYQTMTYRPSFLTLRNFGSERVHAL